MAEIIQPPNEPTVRHEVIYDHEERRTGVDRRQPVSRETTIALTGGSSIELVGGGAAVVLAIIGLAGYLPFYMAGIAGILVGVALLAHGAAAAARWQDAVRRAVAGRTERLELEGGVGSEVVGGAATIVLAILALAEIRPVVMLAVAAIVAGGAVLLGAPAQPELARLAPDTDRRIGKITYQAVEGTSGAMVLAGIAAIVLGILALIAVGPPLTLAMTGMLVLGGALFLGGSALTARFARRLAHAR